MVEKQSAPIDFGVLSGARLSAPCGRKRLRDTPHRDGGEADPGPGLGLECVTERPDWSLRR